MQIAILVAMDESGAIGIENRLPWRLRADLQRFRQLTLGHHLIIGRRTYESIGRPLPGRKMIILSRNPNYAAPGCQVADSLSAALQLARQAGEKIAFIGGGAAVFAETLPLADRIYLTRVHTTVQADTYFPDMDLSGWRLEKLICNPADEENQFAYTFLDYKR